MKKVGLVLAGGRSERFGQDKSLLRHPLSGQRFCDLAVEVLRPLVDEIALVRREPLENLPLEVVQLADPMEGPARAVAVAITGRAVERWYLIPCDMPGLTTEVYRRLESALQGKEIACYQSDGEPQPMVSIWESSAAQCLLRLLEQDPRSSLKAILPRASSVVLEVSAREREMFRNINRPSDYEEWARHLLLQG